MIYVNRLPSPAILEENAEDWTQTLLYGTALEKKNVMKKYRDPAIKQALTEMFNGKCAYCESQIEHIDYGDIEHFKPKSLYPNLAFVWSNLLLACSICNRTYKKTQFPLETEEGPLVDPSLEDPANHLKFASDTKLQKAIVLGKDARGDTTQKTLGLNRPKLVDKRSRYVVKMRLLWEYRAVNPEAADVLRKAAASDQEYSAFVQAFPS